MKITTIIPSNFLPVLPQEQDKDDSNPRRVTLIHKRDDTLVCLLSRDLNEVTYENPVENALVLRMFGPEKISFTYEPQVTFHKRGIGGERFYTLVGVRSDISDKITKKKIPFLGPQDLLSDMVPNGGRLDKKVDDLISTANDYIVAYCETIADRGLLRAINDKKMKEIRAHFKEVKSTVYNEVDGLFREENDNTPVRKSDIRVADRSLDDYFNDPRPLSRRIKNLATLGQVIPILAISPSSAIDFLEQEIKVKYDKRFSQIEDEEEKEAIALSGFAISNPKLMSGIRRGYFEAKAVSNIGLYTLQLLATGYAIHNWSPWLSVPMSISAGITGVTMIRNALRSGGQDYSGIISTGLDALLRRVKEY